MKRKRIDFRGMNTDQFVNHLNTRSIRFHRKNTTTVLGLAVEKITPINTRMTQRIFDKSTGRQLSKDTQLSEIDIEKRESLPRLIKLVSQKINNMATKGVYHPRRLQPKWNSLTTNKQKLHLFRKYMNAPTSSIGFLRLIDCNLPSKTLESIIIDHPEFESMIAIDGLRQKCIDKFKLYKNGRDYLKSKQLD